MQEKEKGKRRKRRGGRGEGLKLKRRGRQRGARNEASKTLLSTMETEPDGD